MADVPIRSVRDGRSKGVKILVYGDPGIGKTRFVGTGGAKTLIIRPPTDNTDSIRDPGVKEWVVRDWDGMWEAFEYVRHEGFRKFDWIWLDSISAWQDQGLDDIWDTVTTEKPHRKRYGLDKQEYGINMTRLGQWVRHMVGMADDGMFNFGITAWPRELPESDDPDAEEKLMPWVQGKNMATKMCGYMNVVAFMTKTRKGTRILYTEASKGHYAKDQFDAFPDGKLLRPTVPEMMKLITRKRGGRPERPSRTAVRPRAKRRVVAKTR